MLARRDRPQDRRRACAVFARTRTASRDDGGGVVLRQTR